MSVGISISMFLSAVILPVGKYQVVREINEAFKTNKYFADVLVAFWREREK